MLRCHVFCLYSLAALEFGCIVGVAVGSFHSAFWFGWVGVWRSLHIRRWARIDRHSSRLNLSGVPMAFGNWINVPRIHT